MIILNSLHIVNMHEVLFIVHDNRGILVMEGNANDKEIIASSIKNELPLAFRDNNEIIQILLGITANTERDRLLTKLREIDDNLTHEINVFIRKNSDSVFYRGNLNPILLYSSVILQPQNGMEKIQNALNNKLLAENDLSKLKAIICKSLQDRLTPEVLMYLSQTKKYKLVETFILNCNVDLIAAQNALKDLMTKIQSNNHYNHLINAENKKIIEVLTIFLQLDTRFNEIKAQFPEFFPVDEFVERSGYIDEGFKLVDKLIDFRILDTFFAINIYLIDFRNKLIKLIADEHRESIYIAIQEKLNTVKSKIELYNLHELAMASILVVSIDNGKWYALCEKFSENTSSKPRFSNNFFKKFLSRLKVAHMSLKAKQSIELTNSPYQIMNTIYLEMQNLKKHRDIDLRIVMQLEELLKQIVIPDEFGRLSDFSDNLNKIKLIKSIAVSNKLDNLSHLIDRLNAVEISTENLELMSGTRNKLQEYINLHWDEESSELKDLSHQTKKINL